MSRVCQISILCRVVGNVNADWTIGQRITLKKMQTTEGEVKPFISARAIKYAIRKALQERGHEVDKFVERAVRGRIRLVDTGDPVKLIDNDLFGFMTAEEVASRRQAPIAISYLRALKGTPISTDLGLRAPREPDQPPLPFETEVAEFIGRLDCLIYDYIGIYQGTEKIGGSFAEKGKKFIDDTIRRKRLYDFLDIFLSPAYVLPRRTNSLQIPEYFAALVMLSEDGPKPIYQYLDYKVDETGRIVVDTNLLRNLAERARKWDENAGSSAHKLILLKYRDDVIVNEEELRQLGIDVRKPEEVINEVVNFMIA